MLTDVEINGVICRGVTVSVEWCGELAVLLILSKGTVPPPPWRESVHDDAASIAGRAFKVRRGCRYEAEIAGRPTLYEWSCRCVGPFPFTQSEWRAYEAQCAVRHSAR